MPSHNDRCDLAMVDLPGQAIGDLTHVPHSGRCRSRTPAAAVVRERRHLRQDADDEVVPIIGALDAASHDDSDLGTS